MPADLACPDPRLDAPLRWRVRDDGAILVGETTYQPWTRLVFEGLEKGMGHAQLVAALEAHGVAQPDASLRRLLHGLRAAGLVRLDFPAPARLGRYEIERELGRGGVGVAWLARDPASGARVVVKHAWGFFASTAAADAQVRHEAAVLAALQPHPALPPFGGAFEEGGLLHLVRGHVEGEGLMRHAWDAARIAQVGARVGEAAAHAHDRGWLLLDLHPQNALLAGAQPVLIDVGQALELREGVATPRLRGTPGFQPPELATRRLDARADVWILGRMLFALAAGVLPRQEWNAQELARRLEGHALAPAIAALAADAPEARPASMREAVARLTASTSGA